jgi:endonuclease/exonuclease/phosphatase family metal-dependent hydrolase
MAKSFRISTFNTENLLHPGVYFGGRPYDQPYPPDIYEDKIDWIARVLREGDVSLVGFQELYSEQALKDIAAQADFPYLYAPGLEDSKNITVSAKGRQEARGPFVGLLSKFPIVTKQAVIEFPGETKGIEIQAGDSPSELKRLPITHFQRPIIQAEVQLKDRVTATIFVVHLKSKRPQFLKSERGREQEPIVIAAGKTRSLIIRAAESVALRQLVVDATQNNAQPAILFGDLNDDLSSVTSEMIAGEEPHRFAKLDEKKTAWDRLLYSVHHLEEQQSYRNISYTHITNGRYELLDHIFVSQEFLHRNPACIATVRSTRIFNDHLQDERRVLNPERGPSNRSDHGVPVTEIEWRNY